MTPAEVRLAVEVCDAIEKLPKVLRDLGDVPTKHHDAVWLELSAAEMADGVGQGSSAYFYLPPSIAKKVLAATRDILTQELKRLNVTQKRKKR